MPPQGTPRKLPRKLRPRRRKEKQSGPTANHNSPSREAGKKKQSGPTANHNSRSREAGKKKQSGPTANHNSPSREAGKKKQSGPTANHNLPSRKAGNQPGTSGSTGSAMRASVKHPLTFLRPQHPQHPRLTVNHNSGRRFDQDPSESGRLFKPARSSIQSDSALISRRDSFSGSPSGLTRNISLTDPIREARVAGGLRPGPVQPHPRAACPDTRLDIDAAPPEADAVSRDERPHTVLDIPESGRPETTRCPESPQRRGSRSTRRHLRKRPRNRFSALLLPKKHPHTQDTDVNSAFPLV